MAAEISPGKPTTRRHSPAEKDETVRLVRALRAELGTEHGTVHQISTQGYGVESVRAWVAQADIDDGYAPGVTTGGPRRPEHPTPLVHCFCSIGGRFAAGWFAGGNRRRFLTLAGASEHPMGVLALIRGELVGWCACGPRSRSVAAIDGRSWLLKGRPRDEDDHVWLIACL